MRKKSEYHGNPPFLKFVKDLSLDFCTKQATALRVRLQKAGSGTDTKALRRSLRMYENLLDLERSSFGDPTPFEALQEILRRDVASVRPMLGASPSDAQFEYWTNTTSFLAKVRRQTCLFALHSGPKLW
jgi:hypothetical protein